MSYPDGYLELGFDLPNQFVSSFTIFGVGKDMISISFSETVKAAKINNDGKEIEASVSRHAARLIMPMKTIENLHEELGEIIRNKSA